MFPDNLLKEIFNNEKIREMFPIDLNKMFSDDILKKISTMYDKIFNNIIEKIIDDQKIPIQQVYLKELDKIKNKNGNLVGGSLSYDIKQTIGNAANVIALPVIFVYGCLLWAWEFIGLGPGMIEGLGKVGNAITEAVKAANFIPMFNPRSGRMEFGNLNFRGYA